MPHREAGVQGLVKHRQSAGEEELHDCLELGVAKVRGDVDRVLAVGQRARVQLRQDVQGHGAGAGQDRSVDAEHFARSRLDLDILIKRILYSCERWVGKFVRSTDFGRF